MARVVIFGLVDNASLAHFYLKNDSDHEVVAFSVNRDFLPSETHFEGLPIVAFEEVESEFPASDHAFFAPLSPRKMNKIRESIYLQIKEKGYECISYISTRATVFSDTPIGDNCFILEDNTIQPFTSIGNNVVLWSGNHIGHHSVIKDHVFFSSHVVLSGHCVVEPYCFLGVNSTVADDSHIAQGCLIAMSAAVKGNTDPWGVYTGNPGVKSKVSSRRLGF